MKVLFVSGPPRSGKDTTAEVLNTVMFGAAHICAFSDPLKQATHALYTALAGTLTPSAVTHVMEPMCLEPSKDVPNPLMFGRTPREAYIEVSELLAKPVHGADVWGRVLAQRLNTMDPRPKFVVITGMGFAEECVPIINAAGADNCASLELEREGCGFEGDSRGYVKLEVPTLRYANDDSEGDRIYWVRTELLPWLDWV